MTGLDSPLGPQEVKDHRSPRKSALEGGKVISPSTGRLYPQEIILVLISVRGRVEAMVQAEELSQGRKSQRPHRLVAQCLNQLQHHVPIDLKSVLINSLGGG
jgi:hypothetical protein